ncbi:phosphoenolpyruvate synthase [Halobacillus salinarum]|uniref:Phosphoenolpyruvate synthase n=1 Tax=Halobacillus salinarum TaxID=2932257 RepID=A0ABY4EN75_9BACI|nr:phosphoenolpyruvate synthase [Halobacillus salinarum]UOQ45906.1 phosphoenolpyruvate synthase [Halobacillus salinarum]
MVPFVLGFHEMEKSQLLLVGWKSLRLGELSKLEDIYVPEGFCITTAAYQKAIERNEAYQALLDQLTMMKIEDRDQICEVSKNIRQTIIDVEIPLEITEGVTYYLSELGDDHAYAVRSSATTEDLLHASFAGQQDTYLNNKGKEAILLHIKKCWASLFTERAVIYRMKNGFDHSQKYLSVIVQRMVFPQASGILFTADPMTSNRKLLSIEAGFGLGEALVSGWVSPDCYKVQEGKIVDKKITAQKMAVYGRREGGTETKQLSPDRQNAQTLTDQQILELARIGRQIETYFGCPQDIEWCLVENTFYMVQSRPITTLFPVPEANDQENHVFISVGHQQMMTDPIKPLGLSFFLLTTNAPMHKAGGRLYVDVTPQLASPVSRNMLLKSMGQHDPLLKDAIMTIIEREGFITPLSNDHRAPVPDRNKTDRLEQIEKNPAIVADLMKKSQASIEELEQKIQTKSGSELFDFILEDIQELKKILFAPQSSAVFMAAINASTWINEKMNYWLGEKNPADTLAQSVQNNITSEMGLQLLDVADVIRPYPEVVKYLQSVEDENFLDEMVKFEGGQESRDAIDAFLNKYGMRCSGEIDITRARWNEKPTALVPMILSNIKNFAPSAGPSKFEQGLRAALEKEKELLERLKQLPDGEQKAKETKRMIDLIRNFIGYREYPKYGMMKRYFVYKKALLKEAGKLARRGVIHEKEDIYYLTLEEFRETVRTHKRDDEIISRRKDEYQFFNKLTPPRLITSDGEIIAGKYRRDHLPSGALAGLPVSSGVIEGRARVILNMEDANFEDGDILVTSYTDPSWTPLFVSIKGLITEVGGLMTHGAVIAREYGLPAVVGVENASQLIKDGQRIRLNGTEGYIELL